ncbi:twin-arginine translocase subunit TatC, partial [Wolbachia endosymbiont of Pentidionis agamae]|uniref:twin-arginine translocase subunit TatC n=1 Tax=Wolbachia endosymbiont of Pentidionis agamae TaxID=3110435 RepID=UPI002FD42F46
MNEQGTKMSLSEHFAELRKRVIVCFLFFSVAFFLCYYFSEKIYNFLLSPLIEIQKGNNDFSLIYTTQELERCKIAKQKLG